MDITCPKCSEPCDMDELHEFDMSFDAAKNLFFTQGCGVLFNGRPCETVRSLAADASAALFDLMPDDVDGIASMMEDFGL